MIKYLKWVAHCDVTGISVSPVLIDSVKITDSSNAEQVGSHCEHHRRRHRDDVYVDWKIDWTVDETVTDAGLFTLRVKSAF